MKISVILPVYNESKILERSVKKVQRAFEKLKYDYEIIIAEDGSTDGTDKIAAALAKKDRKIKFIHSDERLGKGGGIKKSLQYAKGDVFFFTDIDLATDLTSLKDLIEGAKNNSICVGSRLLPDSNVKRDFKRDVISRVYNFLVRLFFNTKLTDMQCGFKAFHKNTKHILLGAKNNGWFWDTEILLLAERTDIKIKQIPINWKSGDESKIRVVRDSIHFVLNLIKLRLRI